MIEDVLDEFPNPASSNADSSGRNVLTPEESAELREFGKLWQPDVAVPVPIGFTGWQMADEEHPQESGRPAYRIVRKTVRTLTIPAVSVTFANARVNIGNFEVTYGEPRFHGAMGDRSPGQFLLPEWGAVVAEGKSTSYEHHPNWNVHIEAFQAKTPHGNFVEILATVDPETPREHNALLAAGRAAVASLTLALDLTYGGTLLGPIVTEEVGEVFDDWHWNRLLGGREVVMESQAVLNELDGNDVTRTLVGTAGQLASLSEERRQAVKIAAQWYWRADSEPDAVIAFISYWLVLEALELGQNANIAPLKRTVANLLHVDFAATSGPIGRLYQVRNQLVHGNTREPPSSDLGAVRAIAVALLEYRTIGQVTDTRMDALREAMGVTGGPSA